ncbi:hypothetical protein APP90_23455 [Salmonella enterica subsp. enterica serovar Sandiego]|nr:hypothetical protein APP90_23455 [Salmonella enterica subsp. enterica serovar Sandiego]
MMKVIIAPALHDLDYVVKCGQRCIGCNPWPTPDHRTDLTDGNFDDIDLHSWITRMVIKGCCILTPDGGPFEVGFAWENEGLYASYS